MNDIAGGISIFDSFLWDLANSTQVDEKKPKENFGKKAVKNDHHKPPRQ